jgi:DNA polymerase I
VVVPVGGESFRKTTGLSRGIEEVRGYVFKPDDCLPVQIKVRDKVGVYKTKRTKPDGTVVSPGDPKWGWVTSEQRTEFPQSVRWILPVLDPISVQKSGLRSVVALKADLARVTRSLGSSFAPLACHFLDIPVGLGTGEGNVAIDIETVGSAISRIGVSDGRCTWTAPWDWRAAARVSEIFASGRTIVGHNLAFDLRYLAREGVRISMDKLGNTNGLKRLFDTMVGAHLLQPDLYKGLGRSASLYLDLQPWKNLSEEKPAEYNAKDAFYTWKLAEAEEVHLQETGQARLFHETMMPALPTLIGMTERGIRVDRERLANWQAELGSKRGRLLDEWNVLAPGTNCFSPSQVAGLLYDKLKLRSQGLGYAKGKSAARSVEEPIIKGLKNRHPEHAPILDVLTELRRVNKMISTYASTEIGGDGCVHPNYLPAGKESEAGAAATGRLASSEPNIQNQPDEARFLFTPSVAGRLLVEVDYSQIELRIAATLANDPALLEALKGDVHARTQELLGCDRVRAKNVVYGSLYGAGPKKLAILLRTRGVDTSERECRVLQNALAAAYPRLWRWRSEVVNEGASRRHLTNVFGRRRYFYGGETAAPQMIDYLPQSTAADIVWDRLPAIDQFCSEHGGALLATVHDSFLMEFPKEEIGPCLLGSLREVLEIEFPQIGPGFRVPVDMKTGSNWGQMEKLDPKAA